MEGLKGTGAKPWCRAACLGFLWDTKEVQVRDLEFMRFQLMSGHQKKIVSPCYWWIWMGLSAVLMWEPVAKMARYRLSWGKKRHLVRAKTAVGNCIQVASSIFTFVPQYKVLSRKKLRRREMTTYFHQHCSNFPCLRQMMWLCDCRQGMCLPNQCRYYHLFSG